MRRDGFSMGVAPFTFAGVFTLPSKSLAEQNPSAYIAALREAPTLKAGLGTCAHCGMAIMNIYIVRDSAGDLWGVGCECIRHITDDVAVIDAAQKAKKEAERAKRAEAAAKRREADRAKRQAEHDARLEAERVRNGGLTDAEIRAQEHQRCIAARMQAVQPILEALAGETSQFCSSIRHEMAQDGRLPRGRGLDILTEILAKQAGRKGSKGYAAAYAKWEELIEEIEVL